MTTPAANDPADGLASSLNRDPARDSTHDLARDLAHALDGDVDGSAGGRAMYGADASNYRRIPLAVAYPRSTDDIATTLRVCTATGVPVTLRGGGTSIAGNAVGPGVVVDTSRYLNRILDIDPDRQTARVQPGVVLADLQAAARPHALRFGPDPSTESRCTLGGMIGNNACGNHSVAWGTTADNVVALDLLTPDGSLVSVGDYTQEQWDHARRAGDRTGQILDHLHQLEETYRGVWRRDLSAYSRRVSGYGVHHLLPENGRSVARALVGSEGTCGIVVGATVRLVAPPSARVLVVLGFADDVSAADAVPALLPHGPLTVEGFDADLLAAVGAHTGHRKTSSPPAGLPAGRAWLFVEMGGDDADDVSGRAAAMVRDIGADTPAGPSVLVVTDQRQQAQLWRIRKDGAGLATRDAGGNEAWPGWEDAAVPPENLGSYLRAFRRLLREYGLRGLNYGHFGEGCIHVRINFDLLTERGTARFRSFVEEAADAVVAHGGSLSGEHGDGMARSSLLSRMYTPEVVQSFEEFKHIWDPGGSLNPGIIVAPEPLDANLRYRSAAPPALAPPALTYPDDDGDLARALRRCVGVGKCRSDDGAVMCPSWLVTREEKHSTRGRARLLQEIVSGDGVPEGWRSEDALDALDLCLSCKGCSSDCPVGVDMATYKAEFLHQHYRGRIRPLGHYSMGWLPLVARVATRMPRLVNVLTASRLEHVLKRAGGVDPERALPRFASRSFRSTQRRRRQPRRPAARDDLAAPLPATGGGSGQPPPATDAGRTSLDTAADAARDVVLWPDTFNNYLSPGVLDAGGRVLHAAGLRPRLPRSGVCCGLTWFSTGQLGMAGRVLRLTARSMHAAQRAGTPVVVLEPSCATMLRSDATAVLGDTPFTRYLRDNVVTLAEALEQLAPDWAPPAVDRPAVGQVHCHQTSALGFAPDERLMTRAGIDPTRMQASCCGLAGNFGFEDGHFDVSRRVAQRLLLPALREAPSSALAVADGYSCRTQILQLAGTEARHLAEILAAHLDGSKGPGNRER